MNKFEHYIPWISDAWQEKYEAIVKEEHLKKLSENIQKYQDKTLEWNLPYFNEEIEINRDEIFNQFISILNSNDADEVKAKQLESIPFENWLIGLGQRLTSASIRDEQAIPPLDSVLIEACQKPFNEEMSIAQRAWEKHTGRMNDDDFWGEVKGNNQQKQKMMMQKIQYILENRTWWNVFFHYKHELVFEVREKKGHGIRWSHGGKKLIGFLEKFINE
ncbi:hypothetical protein [Chryseobacterium sp. CH1]|uniref:hypothetical protein n=1 Tax=Chryseobacterium sp. CH1 TaxID=713551 RepID=UPI00100BBC5E|nr:hypothetical protein [Chryseobacterium sp. CH1]RXM62940.1 hypothetical protein BOQ60_18890 [Chryseobacterium sp. CH1]